MGGAGIEGLEPGAIIGGHTHNFDHTSIFFGGRWHVKKWSRLVGDDGEPATLPDGSEAWVIMPGHEFEREGPFHLLIEAGAKHEFTFLGPGLGRAWCVYSHRTPQGEVSEHFTGWMKAYG